MTGSNGTDSLPASNDKPHSRHIRNVTMSKHPDSYYTSVFISKQISEALDFLAKTCGVSKKKMLDDMVRLGIGHYLGALVAQQNRINIEQEARGEPKQPTYFTIMLRHWAHQKGYDIGKFI